MRVLSLAVVFVSALVLAGPASSAPPVVNGVDPEWNFLVARILPNGNEQVLGTFAYTGSEADQQLIRSLSQEAARQNRTNNPAWRIVIYCPTNSPLEWYVNGDRCWDSLTDL